MPDICIRLRIHITGAGAVCATRDRVTYSKNFHCIAAFEFSQRFVQQVPLSFRFGCELGIFLICVCNIQITGHIHGELAAVYIAAIQHFPPAAVFVIAEYIVVFPCEDTSVRQNYQFAVLKGIIYAVDIFLIQIGVLYGDDPVCIIHQLNGINSAVRIGHWEKGFVINDFFIIIPIFFCVAFYFVFVQEKLCFCKSMTVCVFQNGVPRICRVISAASCCK